MNPVRQGDGVGLSAAGFSEVREGDGTVLWSQGGAIPDSGDLHARYDATQLSVSDGQSVSTWNDETGNGFDLSAINEPTYISSGINGNSAVRFDGVDDQMDATFSTLPQPNHIFLVFQYQSTASSAEYIFDGISDNELFGGNVNNNWEMFAGSFLTASSQDTNAHISGHLFDGGGSTLRIDGTELASGDAGTNGLGGFVVGGGNGGGSLANVDIGEILIYSQDKSGIQSDVEQYLADKWDFTL